MCLLPLVMGGGLALSSSFSFPLHPLSPLPPTPITGPWYRLLMETCHRSASLWQDG